MMVCVPRIASCDTYVMVNSLVEEEFKAGDKITVFMPCQDDLRF